MNRRPRTRRTRAPAKPKLPVHVFAGVGVCCNLAETNLVHDLTQLPAQTAEQRAAEARRYAEHED